MTRKQFAEVLREVADLVESGDCRGGTITFNNYMVDNTDVEYIAVLRTGNNDGMGGVYIGSAFYETSLLSDFWQYSGEADALRKFLPRI